MISRTSIRVGLGIGVALAFATPALAVAPTAFSEQDQADINCLVAVSVLIGKAAQNGTSSTDQAYLGSVLTYFVGKLNGRHPTLRMVELLTPDLFKKRAPELSAETQRCGLEATRMGEDLQAAGKKLTATGI